MNQSDVVKPGRFALSAITSGMLVAFGAVSSSAAIAQDDEEATDLGTLTITGSRLKRADIEGALPVTVIDREQIELAGDITVADLLRKTTFNTFGSFRQQSGSSAQSLVAIDLRGLGSSRTLVLIDGRRAPKAPQAASAQDLNAIPLAAVERIEILQDGASAVYGSDALGGVVNIILRKDFEGVQGSVQYVDTARKGGNGEQASLVAGISGKRGSFVVGVSHHFKDIVFARDSLFNSPGASFFSNNYFGLSSGNFGGIIYDDNGTTRHACNSDTGPGFYTVPFSISPTGLRCAYDFNLVAADEAQIENQGIFTKGRFDINADWSVNVTGSVSRAGSFGRYAPTPGVFFAPAAVMSAQTGGLINEDAYVYHRFAAVGPRDTDTDSNVYDLIVDFQGRIGRVETSFGARVNEYRYVEFGKNYVVRPLAEQAAANGDYNFVLPLSNDPAVLKGIAATINRNSKWYTEELFADVAMPLFDMAGGAAQIGIGAEYRSEDYADIYDSLQEAGVILGSAGNSAGGDRNAKALYVETLWPVLENLELQAVLRYDRYSDYGSDVSPKVSFRYQPLDMLTLRGAWGQGFRAPTLDILTQQPSFSAESISNDPGTCERAGGTFENGQCRPAPGSNNILQTQVDTTILSNPQLESENSDQFTFGVVVEPMEWMDVSLDLYSIQIENRIRFIPVSELVNLDPVNGGPGFPPGTTIIRRNDGFGPGGSIDEVITGFANEGDLDTMGLDLEVNTRFSLGSLGNIANQLKLTHVIDYSLDGGRNQVGDDAAPDLRGNLYNRWEFGPFDVGYNVNYIGKQETVPSYITHDLQFNYEAPWGTRFTVGVLNLFDKEPDSRSAFDGRNYNFYLYDQDGRSPYIRLTHNFR